MINDLVSVCVPTYNGEKYLREAFNSIKNQTYKNIEVIISDDNSNDNTLAICQAFKSSVNFPVYIYNHEPAGIGENWNNTIRKANGQYIKLLFQDDILLPNCIEIMLDYLHRNNLDIVISKREIIDSNSQIVTQGDWFTKYEDLQSNVSLQYDDFLSFSKSNFNDINFNQVFYVNFFGEPCLSLFSKKLFYKVGEWDKNLKQILDYQYFLRVLKYYNVGFINQKLVKFRIHENQTSRKNSNNNINENKIIIDLIYDLFFNELNFKNKLRILKFKFPLFKSILLKYYKIFK